MSVDVIDWVFDNSQARGTTKLVLLYLAERANSDGTKAYPAVATIAAKCGVSERTVQSALKELAAMGEIAYTGRGPRGTNEYRVTMQSTPQISHPAESAPPQDLHPADPAPEPRRSRTPGVQISQVGGADLAPEPSLNRPRTVLEPSATFAEQLDQARKRPTPFDEFWSAYPKKVAKGRARGAWEKATAKADPLTIIAGAVAYADNPDRKPEFTKHPATWLDAECWDDEPDDERRSSKGTKAALRLLERHDTPKELGA